jgi:membrane protein implicated in regulation of membrane protease activity
MADWILWFILAGALVVLEMLTGTFYLLMIAVGVAAGGFVALAGFGAAAQLLVAAVVGALATLALRHSRWGKIERADAARDANVNLDIGETIAVNDWNQGASGATARVMYRGAMWDVDLEPGANAQPGSFIIREMRGNRLIVANK